MTKESGVTLLKTFNSILKMEWAKYFSHPIFFSITNKVTDFLQQKVIFSYKNTYLYNYRTNFTPDSKIEVKSHLGLKVRPLFILIRNQIKNKTLIRFKFYGNDE